MVHRSSSMTRRLSLRSGKPKDKSKAKLILKAGNITGSVELSMRLVVSLRDSSCMERSTDMVARSMPMVAI